MSPDKVLWSLSKGDESAQAVLRRVEDVGLELRFLWNGEMVHSQMYRDIQDLLETVKAKQEELCGRGWKSTDAR